jgi:hypothetical protein
MSGRRSVPRIRTRRLGPTSPSRSPVRVIREIDLEEVDPDRMIEFLRTTGRLPHPNLGTPGSAVPAQVSLSVNGSILTDTYGFIVREVPTQVPGSAHV